MGHKSKGKSKNKNKKALSSDTNAVVGCAHLNDSLNLKKLMSDIGRIQRVCETCPNPNLENGVVNGGVENGDHSDSAAVHDDPIPTATVIENGVEDVMQILENGVEHTPTSDSDDVWLCLLCLRRGCCRSRAGHALGHFKNKQTHCVALSLKTFSFWCYQCDEEIYVTSGHPLVDYILALKNRFNEPVGDIEEISSSTSDKASSTETTEKLCRKKNNHSQCNGSSPRSSMRKTPSNVKGLANIGNTCFFNSTLQCLFHSSHIETGLDSLLRATTYTIPCSKENGISAAAVPLHPAKSPMSNALRDLFFEMNSSSNPLIYPNNLFNQICVTVPRFRGYQQQDAHELLRHLLDTVKSEEVARVKAALTDKLCPGGAKTPEDSSKLKRACEVVANSTVIDNYFGGDMVDTIVCMECHTINTVLQHFLDISLPLKRPNSFDNWSDIRTNELSGKAKRKQLRMEKKRRKPKEDKDGDWGDNDDEDEEVQRALALSMESDAVLHSTLGRPDSGLGSGSSGSDPADSSGFDGLPLVTPTESDELTDETLLASIAALQISTRESFPATQRMSNKELRKRLQTVGTRPPPLDDDRSLYSALYWYTEREELKRENRYACEQCQSKSGNKCYLTEGSKQTLIAKPPKILTLHLKRFEQVESRRSTVLQKISHHIEFPAELDIAPFLSREGSVRHWKEAKELAGEDALPDSVMYSLRGVVEHSGSLNGGHYVAYVRPGGSSSVNGDWFTISDGAVRNVSLENVLRVNAYILFYELDLKV